LNQSACFLQNEGTIIAKNHILDDFFFFFDYLFFLNFKELQFFSHERSFLLNARQRAIL